MAGKSPKSKRRIVTLSLDAVIIGIDANFEPITKAASDYRQTNVYPYLERKGFTVQHLQGSMARRTYVAPAARQANVYFITGLGHRSVGGFTRDFHYPPFTPPPYNPPATI